METTQWWQKDAQTQTECKDVQQQTWLNQFAESAKKQQEQRKAQSILGRAPLCQAPFIGVQRKEQKVSNGMRLLVLPIMSFMLASKGESKFLRKIEV